MREGAKCLALACLLAAVSHLTAASDLYASRAGLLLGFTHGVVATVLNAGLGACADKAMRK